MVTAKRVWWAESAKKDLQQIYGRIAQKSPERGKEVVLDILQKVATLDTTYMQGASVAMLAKETDPYRAILAGFYKVVYSIVGDTVVVETLYHQKQEPVL